MERPLALRSAIVHQIRIWKMARTARTKQSTIDALACVLVMSYQRKNKTRQEGLSWRKINQGWR